jgi:hypothetical protein
MGRRRPELHESLRETAAKTGRFYLFDTVHFNPRVSNYVDHRTRLADLVQRTRYFVVDVANSDRPETAGGQEEFGPRYVEGAAGGAILIGRAPRTATFEAQFWPGAVHPIESDGAAIARTLEGLEEHPEKLERERRANVAQVLRRHDGVYRWEQILRSVGLRRFLPDRAQAPARPARLEASSVRTRIGEPTRRVRTAKRSGSCEG